MDEQMNESFKDILHQLCQALQQTNLTYTTSITETSDGIVRIHQERGLLINDFDFHPNSKGWIDSIVIYGNYLIYHFETISKSAEIFGLKIKSIDIDYDYTRVNIKLDQEQFTNKKN